MRVNIDSLKETSLLIPEIVRHNDKILKEITNITTDKKLPGPDQKTSILPLELFRLIKDLKNYTNLISELKLKEYKFKVIRHRKKDAFLQRIIKNFKRN